MDEVIQAGDIKLLVDPKASLFLIGTEMDYEEEKLKSGFVFRNPNEKGRCGCGQILPRLKTGHGSVSRGWDCRRRSIWRPRRSIRAYFALQRQWHPDRFVTKPPEERARARPKARFSQ